MVIPTVTSNRNDRTTFGYHHYLKDMYRKGMLPSVKKDIYGGNLTPKNVTLEHLVPHSQGGASNLKNYALATKENNNSRGCDDIRNFVNLNAIKEYLNQFRDISITYKDGEGAIKFNGNRYIEFMKATLKKLGVIVEDTDNNPFKNAA